MQLSDTRAVITGGVSGLGLAVARHLVAQGGKAALFDVNDDKGAAAVAELGEANARYFRTDVTDEAGFVMINQIGGVSIRIGNGSPTAARFAHENVAAMQAWLLDLLAVEAA